MAKQNAVWGIDIGQCALKALRCTLDGDSIVADKFDFIEYPKILSQPEAEPEELIKEALERFLSRNDVLGDRVAICVSGQAGLSRFFKPPPVEIKTLPDIVKYEVKQQIPFPIEDVIWDWQQLGGTVVEGRAIDAEVGLFAMKREAVYRALRPFDDAGVEIDVVQLSPLSIFNVVCHDTIENLPDAEDVDPENPPDSTVVLSMGTDTTDLIVTNGIKLWLRNIPIGGNHFTKQLSRDMKLTQAKAEHLKRNARVSENPKAIFQAMRPVFNDLVNEVQRSLTFFQSMEKSANLAEIVLLGNAAKLPGLRQFLGKQLEIGIAKITEFNKLEGSEIISQPTFSNNLLSFAPCYGLCIQGLKKGQIKTNLLPQDIVVERIIRAKKPWVLAAVSALTLGLVLGYFFSTYAWWRVNPQYTDADQITWENAIKQVADKSSLSSRFVASDAEMKTQLDRFNTIANELSSASEGKATWLELYSALSQAFPEDRRIKELKDQGNHLVDPAVIEFEDREELYIDHVESMYFKDLQDWFADVKPIHERMFTASQEDIDAAIKLGAKASDVEGALDDAESMETADDGTSLGEFSGKPGYVIEIKGHHFHNSDDALAKLDAGKSFLLRTLIEELLHKEDVILPTANGEDTFSYSDIGVSYPTITNHSERTQKIIVFDPTATDRLDADGRFGGHGSEFFDGGLSRGPTGLPSTTIIDDTDLPDNTFVVYQYQFIVQMAWTPRSEKERVAARAARKQAAQEAEAAATTVAEETIDE